MGTRALRTRRRNARLDRRGDDQRRWPCNTLRRRRPSRIQACHAALRMLVLAQPRRRRVANRRSQRDRGGVARRRRGRGGLRVLRQALPVHARGGARAVRSRCRRRAAEAALMALYVPKAFAIDDQDALDHLIDEHPFATLVTPSSPEPFVSHLPLLRRTGEDGKPVLIGHFAGANPHAQHATGIASIAIFHGPHAYVSPTWYAEPA